MKHTLVVATTNRGKLRELQSLLADLPLELVTLSDVVDPGFTVIEDGRTFAENAAKKARAAASATMMLTLADDSGLEVDALDGAPGVRSARYAHDRATDAENNAALIAALDALEDPSGGALPRTYRARFRCALALIDPYTKEANEPIIVEGTCEGHITSAPRGSGGFGYDPLFLVDAGPRTMAELSRDEKNVVSHRARALAAMRPRIAEVLRARNLAIADVCR